MNKARVLTLKEALEWNRETVWLQMRWWKAAQQVHYVTEHSPWLQFRANGEPGTEISVKGKEYGKTWRCFDTFPWIGEEPEITIVEGGAAGADSLARDFANENGLPVMEFKPDWKKYGRAAGPKRNDAMVAFIKENGGKALYFWDEESKGTKQCIASAKKNDIDVLVWSTKKEQIHVREGRKRNGNQENHDDRGSGESEDLLRRSWRGQTGAAWRPDPIRAGGRRTGGSDRGAQRAGRDAVYLH